MNHIRLLFSSNRSIARRLVDVGNLAEHISTRPLWQVLVFAAFEAKAQQSSLIEPGHLILGALRVERSYLVEARFDVGMIRRQTLASRGNPSPDAPQAPTLGTRLKLSERADELLRRVQDARQILDAGDGDT